MKPKEAISRANSTMVIGSWPYNFDTDRHGGRLSPTAAEQSECDGTSPVVVVEETIPSAVTPVIERTELGEALPNVIYSEHYPG